MILTLPMCLVREFDLAIVVETDGRLDDITDPVMRHMSQGNSWGQCSHARCAYANFYPLHVPMALGAKKFGVAWGHHSARSCPFGEFADLGTLRASLYATDMK